MKVMFVSNNSFSSNRWAGFQWLADSALRKGDEVIYVHVNKVDDKKLRLNTVETVGKIKEVNIVLWPFYINTKVYLIDLINSFAFMLAASRVKKIMIDANPDKIVVETGFPIAVMPISLLCLWRDRFIIRASDLSRVFMKSNSLIKQERKVFELVKSISVPSQKMVDEYDFVKEKVSVVKQGVPMKKLENIQKKPSEYLNRKYKIVTIGGTLLDASLVERLCKSFPEFDFFVFSKKKLNPCINLYQYGEKPPHEFLPYVKYATVGLAPYKLNKSSEYILESSNKIQIYKYFSLPFLAPDCLGRLSQLHFDYKQRDFNSACVALVEAIRYDVSRYVSDNDVKDWEEVYQEVINV